MDWPLRFGIFLAPFHPVGQNPTLALERDLELIEHLDPLGFDEAWIGEHHSAGYEIIASPEVFIAAAAERTKHIRLGTGVSSLPYHHPLMLADRMVLLDHLTRGRVMFGVGPGALPSDAFMMGIDVARQRDMMEEALEAILALLAATSRSPRDRLVHAQRRPPAAAARTSDPRFEVAVAAQVSPSGPRARRPLRLLAAVDRRHHAGRLRRARLALGRHGGARRRVRHRPSTASDWRLVGPMHIAETKEQAYAGRASSAWPSGSTTSSGSPPCPSRPDDRPTPSELADAMNASGFAVIGTPDDAVAQIQRLVDQSGGFGTFLLMAHEWADREATPPQLRADRPLRVPPLPGLGPHATDASRDWAAENRPEFIGAAGAAIMTAMQQHHEEKAADRRSGAASRRRASLRHRRTRRAGELAAASWGRRRSNPPESLRHRTGRAGNAGKQVRPRTSPTGKAPPG